MKLYISIKSKICADKYKKNSLEFVRVCLYDFFCTDKIFKTDKYTEDIFEFYKDSYGKPFVKNVTSVPIFFSVSHSGEILLCGISHENIGVDCQQINKNIKSCKKIASRFYHKNEIDFLNSLHDTQSYIDNFFEIWTKKEAYIKFTGKGLSEGLSTFSVFDNSLCTKFETVKFHHHDIDSKNYKISIFGNDKFDIQMK